jgi:hypothetical protein
VSDRDPTQRPDRRPPSRRNAVVAMLVVVALIGGMFLLMKRLHRDAVLQDCIASGRTNCAPISTGR